MQDSAQTVVCCETKNTRTKALIQTTSVFANYYWEVIVRFCSFTKISRKISHS